ncbi:MAG: hypothetical protein O2955_08510 [Planctomycetota bacterium]|nr:hypothetical protein [Planctomycetota bacterium]MDA1212546.1 hypothetical protein [Planctomycetota bacterium]
MQGTIAKLTVVAGVIGIGLLALLQVNGYIQTTNTESTSTNDGVDDLALESELDGENEASPSSKSTAATSAPPSGQSEPEFDNDDNWEKELLEPTGGSTETLHADADTTADDNNDLFGGLDTSTPPTATKSRVVSFDDENDDEAGQLADAEFSDGSEMSLNATIELDDETSADDDSLTSDETGDNEPSFSSDDQTEIKTPKKERPRTAELAIDQTIASDSGPQLFSATPEQNDSSEFEDDLTELAPDDSSTSALQLSGDDSTIAKNEFADNDSEPSLLQIDETVQPLNPNSVPGDVLKTPKRMPAKSLRQDELLVVSDDDDPFPSEEESSDPAFSDVTSNSDQTELALPDIELPRDEAADSDGDHADELLLPQSDKPLDQNPLSVDNGNAPPKPAKSSELLNPFPRNEQPSLSRSPPSSTGTSRRESRGSGDGNDDSLMPPQKILPRNVEPEPTSTATPFVDLRGDATVDQNVPQGVLRPHLTIEKVAPKNAVLGQPMVYQIIVRNLGDAEAHQVVVEDRIPRGSQLSGTDPQAVLTDRKLVWDLGTLAANEERTIAVRVVPTSEGSIGSVATVNFVAEITAETIITAPKLELELTGPQAVDVGDTVALHFKLSNAGNSEAGAVFIREIIPAGFEHPSGDDLEYEVGGLSPGQSREVDLKLKAIQPGHYINRAVATAEGGFEVETKIDIEIVGPQFTITRDGPKRRTIGRPAAYSNTIENNGNRILRDVSIEEALPEGMEFVEASDGGQYNEQDRVVIWRLNELLPASRHKVSVVLTPRSRGAMESTVRVVDSRGIPVEVQSLTDVVGHPSLSIDTTALDGPINVGEDVGFRVQIRNRGTAPATNIDVRMAIPPGLKFVAARGLTQDNATESLVSFVPVERLGPDENLEFELVFRSIEPGDSRVKIDVKTDQMQRPLSREEAVVIFSDEK